MFTMEFHPGEGGEDSKLFADELMAAVSKYAVNAGAQLDQAVRTLTFRRL